MKKRTIIFKTNLLFACMALFTLSCTNLDLIVDDSLVAESSDGGFTGVENAQSSLDNLYNALRGQIEPQDGYYALAEVSSDELLIPTRGTDWGDNGIWRVLHTHKWPASHLYVLNVWNGFKGCGTEMALVANCASIPHDPTEISRLEPENERIPYDWALKHK